MTVHLDYKCVSINKDVEITFHTFLTSVLAQSKDEVILVTNKHTEAIKPQHSTKESYWLHTSTILTPRDIFCNPLQIILGTRTPEQM
jgi:hypothetical protein